MTVKLTNIDLRQGQYIVKPYSQTQAGFWISDGEPIRLAGGLRRQESWATSSETRSNCHTKASQPHPATWIPLNASWTCSASPTLPPMSKARSR
jgi:hypothetical protein